MSHTSAGHRLKSEAAELSPVVEANLQDEVQMKKWTHNRMANSNGLDHVNSKD